MQKTGRRPVTRRLPLIVAIAALAVPSIPATAHLNSAPQASTCDGKSVAFHRHRARSILKHEYLKVGLANHAMPAKEDLEDFHRHKLCVRLENVRTELAELRATLKERLSQSLAVTPYYGGGQWWALPYGIVVCESGANYQVGFGGAYGILVSTWLQWGGGQYGPTAGASPPWAQDIIAHEVWTDVGPSGWACA